MGKTELTASLFLVPVELVDSVWIKTIPHFLRGKKQWNDYFSLEQMHDFIMAGRQQLWVMVDGKDVLYAMVTQIDDYPSIRSLRVCYFGGTGLNPAYMPQFRRVETWAKEQGCKMVEFTGLDEWERILAKILDYRVWGKVYRKEL